MCLGLVSDCDSAVINKRFLLSGLLSGLGFKYCNIFNLFISPYGVLWDYIAIRFDLSNPGIVSSHSCLQQ